MVTPNAFDRTSTGVRATRCFLTPRGDGVVVVEGGGRRGVAPAAEMVVMLASTLLECGDDEAFGDANGEPGAAPALELLEFVGVRERFPNLSSRLRRTSAEVDMSLLVDWAGSILFVSICGGVGLE